MTALRDAAAALLDSVSGWACADNSCMLYRGPRGMSTNGGCQCHEKLADNRDAMRQLVSGLVRLRAALDAPPVAPEPPKCPRCGKGMGLGWVDGDVPGTGYREWQCFSLRGQCYSVRPGEPLVKDGAK